MARDDLENFMKWHATGACLTRPSKTFRVVMKSFTHFMTSTTEMQIPGEQFVWSGRTYEKDGYQPKWRAIRDDKGRIIVAICHNMHLGDAWEWADDPNYPDPSASMAFRVGLTTFCMA